MGAAGALWLAYQMGFFSWVTDKSRSSIKSAGSSIRINSRSASSCIASRIASSSSVDSKDRSGERLRRKFYYASSKVCCWNDYPFRNFNGTHSLIFLITPRGALHSNGSFQRTVFLHQLMA